MKAKEAADKVSKNPNMSPAKILELMPDYSNTLHKKQWVHNLLKALPENLQASLRKPLSEALEG
jgi:hypothetical protein